MKAFNGDTYLAEVFADLAKDADLCIETGTYHGDSTQVLATLFPAVITTEIVDKFQLVAKENCKEHQNITFLLGDSPKLLGKHLPEHQSKRIVFFLDSHWYDRVPLLPELHAIAAADLQHGPVIVIHDFFVPGKSDPNNPSGPFGFDVYHGQAYTYEWAKPSIDRIYGEGKWAFQYPEKVAGAQRGYIVILPA